MSLQEDIRKACELARRYSDAYYNAQPEISDEEYDSFIDSIKLMLTSLKDLDPNAPEIKLAEVTLSTVGSPSYGKKVKHTVPLGSLAKITSMGEFDEWMGPFRYVTASHKIDGLTVSLVYEDGKLVSAATRGDGLEGQDVFDNVLRIKDIPKSIAFSKPLFVRGEVYMRRSVFEEHKKNGIAFANCRNAAAGSLMAKDPNVTESRNLSFYAHGVVGIDGDPEDQFRHLTLLHVPIVHHFVATNRAELEYWINETESERANLDYDIDGVVITKNDVVLDDSWERPERSRAYKYKPQQAVAVLEKVEWQVGRTGKITPVARIKPTMLAGSTISNVTLHNAKNVFDLYLFGGQRVVIEKGGDIIPQIVETIDKVPSGQTIEVPPATCPVCGKKTGYDGVNLWCHNSECIAVLERRVLHWLRKVEVDGIGPGIVAALCKTHVKSLSDLYYLTSEKIAEAIGSDVVAEKLFNEIMTKSVLSLATFIEALGIGSVGTGTSGTIARQYKTITRLYDAKEEDLVKLSDIGPTTARNIVDGLKDMKGTIELLLQAITIIPESVGKLSGKSFVITGTMSKPRSEIESWIKQNGGEVKSSVSRGVDFLVQADPNSESSKSKKAKSIGVKVISEIELERMV